MTTNIKQIYEKYKNTATYLLLFIAFLTSFYIRAIIPHDNVFLGHGIIAFAEDDSVYQMRIVEWIIHNYPHFLWFDPYTLYPNGQAMPWAPLYTYSLATIIMILGLGSPSQDLINTVGAYYPAVLGAFVVVPVYYAAKNVFDDRRIGILSSFIVAVIGGQFLSRSVLGFTDHHVAETLFSTITMALLIISVKKARENEICFDDIINKRWNKFYYFIITGISMSLYILVWKGALLFNFIIGIYILVQFIIDHLNKKNTEYLGILGITIFLINLITVLAIPRLGGEKHRYIMALLVGIIAFFLLSYLSWYLNKQKFKRYFYPLFLIGIILISMPIMNLIVPSVYTMIMSSLTFFTRHGGGLTIAEAMPYLNAYPGFTLDPFKRDFGINGVIAFLGIAFLIYETFVKKKQELVVFLVWNIMILWALFQQNRFAYYYAINVAILSSYVGIVISDKILDFGGWKKITDKNAKISINHIISLFIVILLITYLVYPLIGPAKNMAKYGPGMRSYWYNSLMWMKSNTPDPGVDYYGLYKTPESGEKYPYPDTAYGVMSWWDYGHIITYWGHRIPNANPFQSGIGGGKTHAPGASTFLSAQSEEEANKVLDALGTNGKPGARYVITDNYITFAAFGAVMAWADIPYDGYYTRVQTNKGPIIVPYTKRYNAMMMRLHLFDGNGLKTYRLVHESMPAPTFDSATGFGEKGFKDVYNQLFGGNLTIEDTGHVKIFEHVKGAHIKGSAPENSTVSLSLKVRTNKGREFVYSQKTIAKNGSYEFIVPYSTEGPIKGETNFDTKPIGKYKLTANGISREVSVDENSVLNGKSIRIDII